MTATGRWKRSPARRLVRAGAFGCAAAGGFGTGHLLVLLTAAVAGRSKTAPPSRGDINLAVVIPAHNEETVVAAAIHSVAACEYDSRRRRIIVIADNCDDATAATARAAGGLIRFTAARDTLSHGDSHVWSRTRRCRPSA